MADDGTISSGDIATAYEAASGASPAPDPSGADPAASASTDTSDPSAAGPPPPDGHSTSPPEHRWDAILSNARQKAEEETRARIEQEIGWARQFDPQALQAAMEFYAGFNTGDPVEVVQQLVAKLQDHPEHGAKLRSLAARALQSGRQSGQPTEFDQVQIDLGDGRTITLADLKASWLKEVRQEMSPLVQTFQQAQAERAAQTFATTTMQDAKTWAGMDDAENRQAVAQALKAMRITSDDPRDLTLALNTAWRTVVLPKLQSGAARAQVQTINQKAAVSGVTPNAPSSTAPKELKDMSWEQALRTAMASVSK